MCMSVESVDYSVLVNGEQVGPIIPGQGLRLEVFLQAQKFAVEHLMYPIFYLLTTVFFFSKLTRTKQML